jgi:hypothetical protein
MSQIDLVYTTTRPNTSVPWFQDTSAENAASHKFLFDGMRNFVNPDLGETYSESVTDLEHKVTAVLASMERVDALRELTMLADEYRFLTYNAEHGITTTSSSQAMDMLKIIDLALLKQYYNYPPN